MTSQRPRTAHEPRSERQREQWLIRTFVDLADVLVDDFDPIDLLTSVTEHCIELLDAADVGVVLADEHDELRSVASSSRREHVVELIELQRHEGPCLEVFSTGAAIVDAKLEGERWPGLSRRAREVGYVMVHAFPLSHRERVIGAVNVFTDSERPLAPADAEVLRAMADIATISILQHRLIDDATSVAAQLRHALDSRVTIEQAKGILAERLGVAPHDAFAVLRRFARRNRLAIADVAARVVDGDASLGDLDPGDLELVD